MAHGTMTMDGQTFVLVPQREYRQLITDAQLPEIPKADESGDYPALAYARTSVAREIISRRRAIGLTQRALADTAAVRVETLNRIEKAKVTADTATIRKIVKALEKAERHHRRDQCG